MDASRFSLGQITTLLKPHFDDLSFRRLREYSQQKCTINKAQYHLTIFPRHMTVPIGMTLESMVFRVFMHHRSSSGGETIIGEELFLERPEGETDISVWLCRRTEYIPAANAAALESIPFYSDESEMGRVETIFDASRWITIVDGFHPSLWRNLEDWARQLVSRREKTISRLFTLASELETRKTEAEKFEKLY